MNKLFNGEKDLLRLNTEVEINEYAFSGHETEKVKKNFVIGSLLNQMLGHLHQNFENTPIDLTEQKRPIKLNRKYVMRINIVSDKFLSMVDEILKYAEEQDSKIENESKLHEELKTDFKSLQELYGILQKTYLDTEKENEHLKKVIKNMRAMERMCE